MRKKLLYGQVPAGNANNQLFAFSLVALLGNFYSFPIIFGENAYLPYSQLPTPCWKYPAKRIQRLKQEKALAWKYIYIYKYIIYNILYYINILYIIQYITARSTLWFCMNYKHGFWHLEFYILEWRRVSIFAFSPVTLLKVKKTLPRLFPSMIFHWYDSSFSNPLPLPP